VHLLGPAVVIPGLLAAFLLAGLAVALHRTAGGPWHGHIPRHARRPHSGSVQFRSHR
jgi:hypothetical protein